MGMAAAALATVAVLLAAGGARPRGRHLPRHAVRPATVATGLARIGRPLRRLAGRRPDPSRDRRAGVGAIAVAAALLLGLQVALVGAGAAAVAGRWRRLRRNRASAPAHLERDLPDLVDLLSLAVGAGLSVPAALPAVAPLAPDPLRPGLLAAADELAAGRASDEVVAGLGQRWGPPARPLVHALADHLRYGTPVLPALERVAAEARTARRRAAETRARRLPVLLLFPLVLCTLPAFGLLTVAPLVAGTFDSLRGGHLEAPASVAP